jgi:O-antigen/teichoic acid export membrane protein
MFTVVEKLAAKYLPKGSISRDAVLIVFGDGLAFTSTLVTAMLLARIIPINEMGTYRQVIFIGPLVMAIFEFGLSSSIYRFWNIYNTIERSTYIKMILILSTVLGGLASISLALMAPYIANWYSNPDLRVALLITCAFPITHIFPLSIRPVMICKGKPLLATLIRIIFSLAMVFALIIPFYFGANLNQALIIWMIVSFIEMLATIPLLGQEIFKESPFWNNCLFKEIWNYLWPIQAGRIPGIFTSYLDKVTTSLYLNIEEFAAYSLGAREIPFIGQIGYSISGVLIPQLVTDVEEEKIDKVCKLWKRSISRTSLIIYPIIGFCIWFSEPIVRFLFSSTYSESSIPFAVFSSITFVRVIEYASLAKAFGRTEIIMKGAALGASVMIVLSFPLTALLGTWGILTAIFLSTYLSNAYYLYSYKKLLNRRLGDFFPLKELLTLAISSILISGIVGTVLDPLINLSTAITFLEIGGKLFIVFVCVITLYLLFLLFTKKIRFTGFLNNSS